MLYWQVFKPLRWQNMLVVAASYVFYGWWDWRFLGLIAFTSLFSYACGLLAEHYHQRQRTRLMVGIACVTVNLLILWVFKYYDFFADSLCYLLGLLGWQADWTTLHMVLPVGISFYTFQALSYTIDVNSGRIHACRDVTAFLAYISFFPQLSVDRPSLSCATRHDDRCRQPRLRFRLPSERKGHRDKHPQNYWDSFTLT